MLGEGCQLTVLCDWVPAAVPALVQIGELDTARAVAARELAQAEAFGAPRRLAAARSVFGSLDPSSDGERLLRGGVELVRDSPARLQHAASLLALGAWLVDRGRMREARDPLGEALELADRMGAASLAAAALTGLHSTGTRPRRAARTGVEALTASELRSARMAANGQPNREIARRLFVSTKTVEAQLSSAYRKLEIAGRHELTAALTPNP
jgi:DNA-binding CsgD family transcriptional regulator